MTHHDESIIFGLTKKEAETLHKFLEKEDRIRVSLFLLEDSDGFELRIDKHNQIDGDLEVYRINIPQREVR